MLGILEVGVDGLFGLLRCAASQALRESCARTTHRDGGLVGVDVGVVSRVLCRRILGGGVIAYGGSAPPLSKGPQGHCLRREIGATQRGIPGADRRRAA